jgi:hypothetical protein
MVLSDGTHHTRSFLDGSRVGLLVAWYSGPVLNTRWLHGLGGIVGIEPMMLNLPAELEDMAHLSLVSV